MCCIMARVSSSVKQNLVNPYNMEIDCLKFRRGMLAFKCEDISYVNVSALERGRLMQLLSHLLFSGVPIWLLGPPWPRES